MTEAEACIMPGTQVFQEKYGLGPPAAPFLQPPFKPAQSGSIVKCCPQSYV